jgi:hypothetical protein
MKSATFGKRNRGQAYALCFFLNIGTVFLRAYTRVRRVNAKGVICIVKNYMMNYYCYCEILRIHFIYIWFFFSKIGNILISGITYFIWGFGVYFQVICEQNRQKGRRRRCISRILNQI